MSENQTIRVYVESTDGERFECELPRDAQLSTVAADFFESRDWPTRDSSNRAQRAVVELVDAENPQRTKRLRGDQSVEGAGLWEGAILRIFPESIAGLFGAGAVDERERRRVLIADHLGMQNLVQWNPHVRFEAKPESAPFDYTITMDYRSFRGLEEDHKTPRYTDHHQVHIVLRATYPRQAPTVQWLTPIFHPNIDSDTGAVCLGVLMDRFLPGMGLARLVTMLTEMVQWRNFDLDSSLNKEAARWAADTKHWDTIIAIGGSPFQGPVYDLFAELHKQQRTSIQFKPITFTPSA